MSLSKYIKKSKEILKEEGLLVLLKKSINYTKRKMFGEEISKKKIKKLLGKTSSIILEIGAADGKDTEEFSKKFPFGKIYAFEPDKRNLKILRKKFKNSKNVIIIDKAISNKNGKISFFISNNSQGNWTYSSSIKKPKDHLKYFPNINFNKKREVNTITLDSWVKKEGLDKIDFIWADVQGAEKELILGGLKTLNKKVKFFYTEFSKKELYEGAPSLNNLINLLPGFEIIKIWDSNLNYGNVLFKNKTYS